MYRDSPIDDWDPCKLNHTSPTTASFRPRLRATGDAHRDEVDLTQLKSAPPQRLPPVKRFWRTRTVRRTMPSQDEQLYVHNPSRGGEHTGGAATGSKERQFKYIGGLQYFFQHLVRDYTVVALVVWLFLFCVEVAMLVIYVLESIRVDGESWVHYDNAPHSVWFYARVVLTFVSLLQMLFAYSVSLPTMLVVICTSVYQIVIFFVSFGPGLAWVSEMYVPSFMRCWPMRHYFLLILDSIDLLTPARSRNMDLVRLAAGPVSLFVCLLFTFSSLVRISQQFRGIPMNVAVAIYFTVVTVTTLGFGDVTVKTPESKALVMCIIIIFLSRMPTFIQVMRSTVKIFRAMTVYSGRLNHFIVYGLTSRDEAQALLDEVFGLYPVKSVCFCAKSFSQDVLSIGRDPRYRLRCKFLTIESLDRVAMRRLKADRAAGIFILPLRDGYSSRVDDDVMLNSIIFERLVPHVPQYTWLRYGLHASLLTGHRVTLVDGYMKKTIMASALLLPGIVPFLVNLVRTASATGEEPSNLWTTERMDDWRSQYEYSRRNVISACKVPPRFHGLKLTTIVSNFKRQNVLIVAVQDSTTEKMKIDLDYVVQPDDTLLAIYERQRDSLAKAMLLFWQAGPLQEPAEEVYGTHFRQDIADDELIHKKINASFVFYPYTSAADLAGMESDGRVDVTPPTSPPRASAKQLDAMTEAALKRQLQQCAFVAQDYHGIPLDALVFSSTCHDRVSYLLKRLEGLEHEAFDDDLDERLRDVEAVKSDINHVLNKAAMEQATSLSKVQQMDVQKTPEGEVFLFVDQTSSYIRKGTMSVYEDVISQTISRYELYLMMRSIRSIHEQSSLAILTLRTFPKEFLEKWESIFKTPLFCIRGQGSLDAHLNYALTSFSDISRVRGVLVYCSQMGARDFGDVPILSVESSVRELLEWNQRSRDGQDHGSEQNIMLELETFTSCVKVFPFHTDAAWRRRGEINFQDSLAFMAGRCFSSNMLSTLLIHSHREWRLVRFFECVLTVRPTSEMFDSDKWGSGQQTSQTLFKLCGNRALQFETYGDAFEFLLSKRSCIAIGVFRQFPLTENLTGTPRYFITNPPLSAPLFVEDIIYCLDGKYDSTSV